MANAVVDTDQPRLQVGENQMDDRQVLLGNLWITTLGNSEVLIAALTEAPARRCSRRTHRATRRYGRARRRAERVRHSVRLSGCRAWCPAFDDAPRWHRSIAAPIVSNDQRSRRDGALDEPTERLGATVEHDGEPNASGIASVFPHIRTVVELGARLSMTHLAKTAWPRARSVVSNEPRTVRTPGRSRPICWTRTSRGGAGPEMERRHLLHLDRRGMALSRRAHRPLLTAYRRLGSQRQAEEGFGAACPAYSACHATPTRGLIHHSDRGSQYCSIDYQAVLKKHGLLISMSGKGNCYDNAVVETFFKTIKSELIWPVACRPAAKPRTRWPDTSDGFYNPIRRHSTLGYRSPVQFEMADRE